jgi:surface antigen
VTNLIPQVSLDDEQPATGRPRNTAAPRLTHIPRRVADTANTDATAGRLKAASYAPPIPNAPAKKTGAPRIHKTLPPETLVLPALPESAEGANESSPGSSGDHIRGRRRSTARPVRPEDTAVVARQTLILNALEIVREDAEIVTAEVTAEVTAQVPAIREPDEMVIVDAEPLAPRARVTLVPAGELIPTPPWLQPRRQQPRSLVAGFVTCLITLGLILGVLGAVSPLGNAMAHGGISPFGLLAAQNASNTASGDPSGPWDTQSGAYLGLGGGAGPGVKAPGSAGLPSGKSSGDSGSKSNSAPPKSNSGISSPPVHPWPPRWAYMYVPGHPAFGVSRPSNNFYWWAFGQCTWWAQYKRQDENLRHMGNARYWASSAAARGYRVGRTPVKGATVVFQPGVEGAGGAGHVAHVEAVYPGGWFLVSEMNFYWNGGGWGRVDYRFAYARSGVSFIY